MGVEESALEIFLSVCLSLCYFLSIYLSFDKFGVWDTGEGRVQCIAAKGWVSHMSFFGCSKMRGSMETSGA